MLSDKVEEDIRGEAYQEGKENVAKAKRYTENILV